VVAVALKKNGLSCCPQELATFDAISPFESEVDRRCCWVVQAMGRLVDTEVSQ